MRVAMIPVMEATIAVTGLRKRFGPTQALDGLTFTVTPGQITGFVGPNGAGKSTTMRVILGLDAPDAGTALIGGHEYRTLRHPGRWCGRAHHRGGGSGGRGPVVRAHAEGQRQCALSRGSAHRAATGGRHGALLAVAAVLALAVGTILRRSAGAVTIVIAVIVLPYILASASVLPAGPSEWLLRLTPAAGFAIQQSLRAFSR